MQYMGRVERTILGGLIGLVAIACLVTAQSAEASGAYNVAECSPGHASTPDATASGNTTAYSAATSCESGNWLQVQSGSQSPPGGRKEWTYTAPAYTEIERVKAAYNLVADPDNDGHRSYLFVKAVGQAKDELSTVNSGSTSGTYDSDLQPIGPFEQVGIGMRCGRAYDPCALSSSGFSRLAAIEFRVKDTRPPEAPAVVGAPVEGAWASADATIGIGDIDYGAGTDRSKITVNGIEVIDRDLCTGVTDASGYASEMAPCEFVYLHSETLNTRSSVFNEGSNTIRVCSTEFGIGGASTCTQKAIKVDNVAPTAPQSLAVEWRSFPSATSR